MGGSKTPSVNSNVPNRDRTHAVRMEDTRSAVTDVSSPKKRNRLVKEMSVPEEEGG